MTPQLACKIADALILDLPDSVPKMWHAEIREDFVKTILTECAKDCNCGASLASPDTERDST